MRLARVLAGVALATLLGVWQPLGEFLPVRRMPARDDVWGEGRLDVHPRLRVLLTRR
jgi:hypothetical protein